MKGNRMNNMVMIQDADYKVYLINKDDIRIVDALTKKTSRITWKDNTTTEINIELSILIEKITGITPSIKEKDILDESIDELFNDIAVRSYNCIKRAGIKTIRELTNYSYSEIAAIRNCGKASATEIVNVLKDKYGLEIRKEGE
jgi:DNA-directed RNA polymerase alpha subunit